ncbi:MAG: polysaccharide deacetylase family protein [Oscillospiraceae bacterium]|nr:polysaccharide deacetylase family protein [Oscillospiraceae bacterium]
MKFIRKAVLGVVASAVFAFSGMTGLMHNSVHAGEKTKLIALTFDDGPNTTTTNEVLDILEEYHAKASFFLIGVNINEESAVSVRRAYDMGMEIDNHSKTHANMSKMTTEEIQDEINYVDEKVLEITGESTKFFRPPFIDVSDAMYDAIDLPFICGIDCQDYMPNVTAEERAEYILNGAQDGVIVLLHDAAGNSQTVEALKIAMPELVSQGYEFVTLTELFEQQGETPKHHILYSNVSKYPCADYSLYAEISSGTASQIALNPAQLAELGNSYAIEMEYTSSNGYPPVVALQKWSGDSPVWKAVQPFYSNGEKAVFLASDILKGLEETGLTYETLDGMTLSAYGGTITLADAKLLIKSESSVVLKGDVNYDGEVSTADLVQLAKWLHCSGTLANWKNADMTEDNLINIYDFIALKQELLNR